MDSQHERDRAAAHYAGLAMQPGWWDYCRHQVAELEQDDSGLYAGLRAEVRKRIADHRASVAAKGTEPERSGALVEAGQGKESLPGSMRLASKGAGGKASAG